MLGECGTKRAMTRHRPRRAARPLDPQAARRARAALCRALRDDPGQARRLSQAQDARARLGRRRRRRRSPRSPSASRTSAISTIAPSRWPRHRRIPRAAWRAARCRRRCARPGSRRTMAPRRWRWPTRSSLELRAALGRSGAGSGPSRAGAPATPQGARKGDRGDDPRRSPFRHRARPSSTSRRATRRARRAPRALFAYR